MFSFWCRVALVCCGLVLCAPSHEANSSAVKADWQDAEKAFQEDLAAMQLLIEGALAWRLEARDMYQEFEAKIEQHVPLTHADIELIHTGSEYYLELREKLLVFAQKHKKYVAPNHHIRYSPGMGSRTTMSEDLYFGHFYQHIIDPADAEGRLILNKIKLSLAAALVLYDNYLVAIYPYQENSKLRKLINFDNVKAARKLDEVTISYLSIENRNMVKRAISVVEQDVHWQNKQKKGWDSESEYLNILITGSLSYEDILHDNALATTIELGGEFSRIFQDNLRYFSKESFTIVSALFGNTVGLVETREGKLKGLSEKELQDIENQLEPLDILLEKTPFRLTDKFIPGYYGHVAVWVGGPADWQEDGLNILDEDVVQENLARIANGRKVVEALRQGVQINSLAQFMNIDDLVVLRHTGLNRKSREEYLVRALAQVGKKYDFNFDVETDRKIVCSELAYVIFHDVPWQTEQAVGRYTISPDNVAQMALGGGPFEVVRLYHDGRQIKHDQEKYFAMLLAGTNPGK